MTADFTQVIDLTKVIVAVMVICSSFITAFAIPWIKSKTNISQRELLVALAKTAVYAAQQIYDATDGAKKKQYAFNQIKQALDARNIYVNDVEISETIESVLKEIKTELNGVW